MAFRYIGAGVKADCKILTERFIETKSVRYEEFVKIWKEMQFPCIYAGRTSFAELYEFIEEVLHIAKEIFLPLNNLQTRVCGLYLLYGLYYKQPTIEEGEYLVKIRLNMAEWQESCSLMNTLREQRHYDALFIFNKLIVDNAFHFCAMPREYGLEKSLRKYLERGESTNEEPIPKAKVLMLEDSGLLNSLDDVCKKYYSFKCALNKNKDVPDKLLDYVSPNIALDLRKLMEPVKNGKKCEQEEEFDIGTHRQKLRQRAACFAKPGPSTSKDNS